MLRLITMPLRVGMSVAGGAIGFVRSRLADASPDDAPVHTETARKTAVRDQPVRDEPAREKPVHDEPAHRDASASDWGEDAPVPPGGSDPDDLILLDRVKTEIFRPGDVDKGQVNVNVENGVVYLRGDLDDPDQIEYLAVAAEEVEGVVRVENLIGSGS